MSLPNCLRIDSALKMFVSFSHAVHVEYDVNNVSLTIYSGRWLPSVKVMQIISFMMNNNTLAMINELYDITFCADDEILGYF